MSANRGKKFEGVIRRAFEEIPGVSLDRLHDQTTGFKGSQNICDFIVYKEPYEYYIECKTISTNTLPFRNITDTQYRGLLEKAQIPGVYAGILCWWTEKDVTKYIPIGVIERMKNLGEKSIRYSFYHRFNDIDKIYEIPGKKKRVFFDYDMRRFFDEVAT